MSEDPRGVGWPAENRKRGLPTCCRQPFEEGIRLWDEARGDLGVVNVDGGRIRQQAVRVEIH